MSQSVHVDSFLLERFAHTCKPSIGRDRRSLGSLIVSLACLEPSKPTRDPALKDKDPEKQTFPLTSVSTHLCIHMHWNTDAHVPKHAHKPTCAQMVTFAPWYVQNWIV